MHVLVCRERGWHGGEGEGFLRDNLNSAARQIVFEIRFFHHEGVIRDLKRDEVGVVLGSTG